MVPSSSPAVFLSVSKNDIRIGPSDEMFKRKVRAARR
jgi:hypothetical protein